MKKALLLLVLIGTLCAMISCNGDKNYEKVSIGTIDYCNVILKTGQAISQIWTEMGVESEVVLTNGSVDSAERMDAGRLKTAIMSQGVGHRFAVRESDAERPSNIRSGVVLSFRYAQAWTIREDIKDYLDFEGKVICVGPEGSSGKEFLEMILNALGVKPRKLIYGDYSHSKEILSSGRADVMFGCLEAPSCILSDDVAQIGARFIFPTDVQLDIIVSEVPVLLAVPLPPTAYGEEYSNVFTIGDYQVYCFSKDVSEELVYSFIKTIYERKHVLELHSEEYKDFGPEYLSDLIIPLHNGAYRYYVEKGYWVPDAAKPIDENKEGIK